MNIRPLLLPLAALLLILTSCDPFNAQFDDVEEAIFYQAQEVKEPPTPRNDLLVMNWNIKFGGGRLDFFFDCIGDKTVMDQGQVLQNLEGIVDKIRQVDPDLLLVQEVDRSSRRTAYIDQVQWILDRTDLNYAAYASQWRADYVPSDGLGRMDMGNALFSKYPITDAQRLALPLIDDQDGVTRYFYLKRNILDATVEIPGFGDLQVLTVHADAYGKDGTKKLHIQRFKQEMDRHNQAGRLFIATGDLNTLPPGTENQHVFADAVCQDDDFIADDFREEADWLTEFYEDYTPAIPLADYQAHNEPYFTHSVAKDVFWNRKIDYIFTNGAFLPGSGLTHQDRASGGIDTMELSDHAPLTARLLLEVP